MEQAGEQRGLEGLYGWGGKMTSLGVPSCKTGCRGSEGADRTPLGSVLVSVTGAAASSFRELVEGGSSMGVRKGLTKVLPDNNIWYLIWVTMRFLKDPILLLEDGGEVEGSLKWPAHIESGPF